MKNNVSIGKNNGMWRSDIDDSELVRLYTVENMSLNAIGKLLDIDHAVVKRHLELCGIEIVKKPRSDKSKDNSPAKKKLFYKYRMQSLRRGIDFDLKYDFFLELVNQKCYYCNGSPNNKEITPSGHTLSYNGIDRKNNSSGYIVENVVPCCKVCNQMKSNIDFDVFLNQIKLIQKHLGGTIHEIQH